MEDARHAPLYSIPECARYLGLPVPTVRSWVAMPGSDRKGEGKPLVIPSGSDPTALSFMNLVEVFVLSSLRRNGETPTKELLDNALSTPPHGTASETCHSPKPDFCSKRLEYDDSGAAVRFYPFTRGYGREDPKMVVIDPAVKFGRPVIAGTGVPTKVIAKFVKTGESMLELAEDYRVKLAQIEEAIRYELAG